MTLQSNAGQPNAGQSTTGFLLVLILTLGLAATVGTALGFEHLGGYIPCALCLKERTPYYASIVIGTLALIAMKRNAPLALARLLVLAIGALMLWSLGMGIYHSGVEWGFWEGPAECAVGASNAIATDAGDLLKQLQTTHAPSCTEAAGRFLGLSFAGWNVIASLFWLGVAALALKTMRRKIS